MNETEMQMLRERADAVRASGALGQSTSLLQLFDYLRDASLDGRAPKESEIAVAIFSRPGAYNPSEDATVRVNVHRLRKKLEEHARAQGEAGRPHLTLPKGEYRLILERAPTVDDAPAVPAETRSRSGKIAAIVLTTLVVLSLVAAAIWASLPKADEGLARTRSESLWAPLLASSRPTSIVVGDYLADVGGVGADAPLPQGDHAQPVAQLMPIAVAPALQMILPIVSIQREDWRTPRTLAMSETTPDRIKLSNIVYVGFIGGLGDLQRPLAHASRLNIGRPAALLDQLPPSEAGGVRGDLAYIASFPGPNGNRIVVIAGFHDAGLIAAAEIATSPETLNEIARRVGNKPDFEALFAVSAMDTTNVGSRPVLVRALDAANIWNAAATKRPGGAPPPR